MNHIFAVCAYGESIYLENCLQSLINQEEKSSVIICTSTPNEYIQQLSDRYGIPIHCNPISSGIGADWNYAYSQANTDLVTLAHQDDLYDPTYLSSVLNEVEKCRVPQIIFTDYYEIRKEKKVYSQDSNFLRLKERMLSPLRHKTLQSRKFCKRLCIGFGNAICCPSVTYVKSQVGDIPFQEKYQSNMDWALWEKLSLETGAFLYIHKPLIGHRIHEGSTTTKVIGDGHGRSEEDLEILNKIWPTWIAKEINRLYREGQESNYLS